MPAFFADNASARIFLVLLFHFARRSFHENIRFLSGDEQGGRGGTHQHSRFHCLYYTSRLLFRQAPGTLSLCFGCISAKLRTIVALRLLSQSRCLAKSAIHMTAVSAAQSDCHTSLKTSYIDAYKKHVIISTGEEAQAKR